MCFEGSYDNHAMAVMASLMLNKLSAAVMNMRDASSVLEASAMARFWPVAKASHFLRKDQLIQFSS